MASEAVTWRAPELGERREIEVDQGTIGYHDTGSGEPIVFVHGALVNSNLWRKPVARLKKDFRCITLDLPFGSHHPALKPDAQLTPDAVARMVAQAIEKIGVEKPTVVGNDTGGAITQIMTAQRPELPARLVLTSCDAFEEFPPSSFKTVMRIMSAPGVLLAALTPARLAAVRKQSMKSFAKHPIDDDRAARSWIMPPLQDGGVRRDARKLIKGIAPRYTLEAAEKLKSFDRPVLVAFSRDDGLFRGHAERLADLFPQGRLEWIEDAKLFSMEDQPERLTELIAGFVREPAPAAAA